jgi:pimeloyl-ACP methyl ester carboxylesterase
VELAKVRETEQLDRGFGRISGTVSPGDVQAEWMVVYLLKVECDEDWARLRQQVAGGTLSGDPATWSPAVLEAFDRIDATSFLAEHVVLERPGVWWAELAAGCYAVGAFADLDRDYRYDDEPVAGSLDSVDRLIELRAGDQVEGVELVIDSQSRIRGRFDLAAEGMRTGGLRTHDQQLLVSVGEVSVEGEVVDLADARFGAENGRLGYFQIYPFLLEVGAGIFFLEEYDPGKVPVLFVHGALGYPQEFAGLIAGLDSERYQPWFFFYPSGGALEAVAEYLTRLVTSLRLRLRHDFDELAVVAHSMGGLVSREFILRHHERSRGDPIDLFVSISTPWGGVPSAEAGVDSSPFVVPSWRDLTPKSPFLTGLFFTEPGVERRRLPGELQYHLLFSVGDQTVPLTSLIRWEALREAEERWPLPYGHADVLASPEASRLLNEVLDRAH